MTNPRDDLMALAPCPFCGSTSLCEELTEFNWPIIQCNDCGAQGPCIDIDKDKVIERWNIRSVASLLATQQTTSKLGAWLAAALDDPNVCAEMKADIEAWMNAGEPAYDYATQVVDREAVARAVADRPWEEDHPLGSIGAFNAKGRKERDLAKADRILSLLRPAEPAEAEHPASEWSLSDDVKRRISEIDENIRHAAIASPVMKAGGIQPSPDAVGEQATEAAVKEIVTHPPKSPDTSAEEMREALLDATANLVGAASAYRKHAARHRSIGRAIADPFFTTRAGDLEKAAERAQAAIRQLPTSKD